MIITTEVKCPFCGRISSVDAPASGLSAWEKGEHIQNALPELSVDERELLKTGICNKCLP